MGLDIMNMRLLRFREIAPRHKRAVSESNWHDGEKSFEDVKRSFEKIADLISTSWEADSHSCLLTNEIIMMSARYRYWHNLFRINLF